MLHKHFKTHRPKDWIESQKRVRLQFPPKKTNKKNPPQSPQTKRGEDCKQTVRSCRGCAAWRGHGWVPVWAGAGKGLFWENCSLL